MQYALGAANGCLALAARVGLARGWRLAGGWRHHGIPAEQRD
jgi:hypothetical protein